MATNRLQRFAHWLKRRDVAYIFFRLFALIKRYGLTPTRAQKRIRQGVQLLARYNCYPTFPTPGRVVEHNAAFCRELQTLGAEIAIHGYDHVDFNSLSPAEATQQFNRAAEAFRRSGIQFAGFRCPYLSYSSSRLATALPSGMFKYSSNHALTWDVLSQETISHATPIFGILNEFYQGEPAATTVATPCIVGDIVEIPASLPDDLTLYDGLKLGKKGMEEAWCQVLHRIHQRGELFVVMFHPETFENCVFAFESLLRETQKLKPAVWITRLADVSEWWLEKSRFSVKAERTDTGTQIAFDCTKRATILIRNLETRTPTHTWDDTYRVLENRALQLDTMRLPFIGVSPQVSNATVNFLTEQGYLLEIRGQKADDVLYLDEQIAQRNEVEIIEYIENTPAPLVKFGRWPNEAKSAFCISGDLDALSLMDYIVRLFTL